MFLYTYSTSFSSPPDYSDVVGDSVAGVFTFQLEYHPSFGYVSMIKCFPGLDVESYATEFSDESIVISYQSFIIRYCNHKLCNFIQK